jgi:hypothetical protein
MTIESMDLMALIEKADAGLRIALGGAPRMPLMQNAPAE